MLRLVRDARSSLPPRVHRVGRARKVAWQQDLFAKGFESREIEHRSGGKRRERREGGEVRLEDEEGADALPLLGQTALSLPQPASGMARDQELLGPRE